MAELIHIAKIRGKPVLTLMKESPEEYRWYNDGVKTDLFAKTPGEAMRVARKEYQGDEFSPVLCGTLFTLPERDEHGMPALYWQMMKSKASMNGVYFDETMGHNCIVRDIPLNPVPDSNNPR